MDVLPGVEVRGLALYVKPDGALIFGDLHLGFEDEFIRQGIAVPRIQYKKILRHLDQILQEISPLKVIINGDLKHEFGAISKQEWSEVTGLLDHINSKTNKDAEVILLKGNHDTILGPIAEKKNVKILSHILLKNSHIYVTHGHIILKDKELREAKTITIGHEHPCIGLRDGARAEKVKCYLKGEWGRKKLVVMPSMNFITEGINVLQEQLLSPFLRDNPDFGEFEVYALEDSEDASKKPLYFGRIKDNQYVD